MVALFAEKGIIAGAFIYMLYLFLTKFSKTQETISETMLDISRTMLEIRLDIGSLNERVDVLEKYRMNGKDE